METIGKFLTGYWQHARWYLAAVGGIGLVLLVVFRRPGRASAILLVGVYGTLTAHFLSVREQMGFSQETALAIVIISGLALVSLVYYLVFIHTE